MRLRERVKRLEIVTAPGELPIAACFAEVRADGKQVTGGAFSKQGVPPGLTMPEFEAWAHGRGLRPLMIRFTDPKPRRKHEAE